MLILLDHEVPEGTLRLLRGPHLLHRPESADGPDRAAVLTSRHPDVLITRTAPDAAEETAWRTASAGTARVVLLVGAGTPDEPSDDGELSRGAGPIVLRVAGTGPQAYAAAAARAERAWWQASAESLPPRSTGPGPARPAPGGRSVALVGAGVVNLVTALQLLRDGHRVTVHDAAPDPRASAHWTAYGCTRGGGDGRMFTLTEADGYHRTAENAPMPFRTPVEDGGWLLADADALSPADLEWAAENTRVPPWLGRSYTEDILRFNRVSGDLWRELLDAEPVLAEGVGLREGILRLYTDADRLRLQTARQDRVGATLGVHTPEEVARRHPALGDACRAGAFAGGIEVVGFTVQIHLFTTRLVDLIEEAGGTFHWQRPVLSLARDDAGRPDGLVCEDGVVRADHYVVSPGVYGGPLLRGTAADGMIHAVMGVWLTLPNTDPALEHSLKIAWPGHRAEDSNVTVVTDPFGTPQLLIGSGYGWTGADPANIDPRQLESLYAAVETTAERFFPRSFEQARSSGLLKESRKYCMRPWTASSLPVLEMSRHAAGGLLVVTGGHNTGGFAQAPAVAQAVSAALGGRAHPMHTLYHPGRLRAFLTHH